MNKKIKKRILLLMGIFFIGFGIFAMDLSIYHGQPGWTLWICYIGMIVIGLGMVFKNSFLILSQLNILAIPLLFWDIDFIYQLITKKSLWHISEYFFFEMMPAARIISFEHIFLIPLTILALYLIKVNKKNKAWILSLSQVAIFFILSRIFTQTADNVNCVFKSCFPLIPSDFWYPVWWLIIACLCVLAANSLIKLMPCFLKNNQKNNS